MGEKEYTSVTELIANGEAVSDEKYVEDAEVNVKVAKSALLKILRTKK